MVGRFADSLHAEQAVSAERLAECAEFWKARLARVSGQPLFGGSTDRSGAHRCGRTSSGDGGCASHPLTSNALCTIRVGLRSPSGIYPGPRWGRCWKHRSPSLFSGAETIPAPRPPPSEAAHYITTAGRSQAPSLLVRPSLVVRGAITLAVRSPTRFQHSSRAGTLTASTSS